VRPQLFKNFRWALSGEPQSMVVQEGLVVERGAFVQSEEADVTDLEGAYMLPSFVDSHCHILPTGLDLKKLDLSQCSTREEVLDAVQARAQDMEPGKWLMAVHYDQNRFADGRHLTRHELDGIVSDRPVVLRHSNGHASVANTAALQSAGVDAKTPDPRGGEYVRNDSGSLTGVLLETAHESVSAAAPMASVAEMADAILEAGKSMARYGISCASDMMTGGFDLNKELAAYKLAIDKGCPIRIRLYLQWSAVLGKRAVSPELLSEFQRLPSDIVRIAGLKVFADGAIGSATAAIYGRFLTTEGDQENDGQLIYDPERLNAMVQAADEEGYSLAIHTIGDRSTDLVMDALSATERPEKHRIEHAMLLSDSQITRLADLGSFVTMQPEFLNLFANSYKRQLPPDRFAKLERARSVLRAGIPLALNSDRPIVSGNPWTGIQTSESRPEGFDASENLTRAEAVSAYTREGSRANGDGDRMGTLEPGALADFCLYEHDPMSTPSPMAAALWMSGRLVVP
jgi:predicted amidohydrolase YtcJ